MLIKLKRVNRMDNSKNFWVNSLFGDALLEYIEYTKNTVQASTYDSYIKYGTKIAFYFNKTHIYVHEISPNDIEDYYNYLRNKSRIKENTVRHYHVLIYKFCKWLYKRGYRDDNPADKIDKPKVQPYRANYYTEEQAHALIITVKNNYPKWLPAIILALEFGLRRSELCAVRFKDINLESNILSVNGKIVKIKKEKGKPTYLYSNELKSESSRRVLPFGETFATYIKSLITPYTKPDDFVFSLDGQGGFVLPDRITYQFNKMLKDCNLPHIRFHDLRHSCASILINNDISMRTVQDWLGHSSYNTTANLYSHVYYKSKVKCLNTLEKVIF